MGDQLYVLEVFDGSAMELISIHASLGGALKAGRHYAWRTLSEPPPIGFWRLMPNLEQYEAYVQGNLVTVRSTKLEV